jgi:hypothetical protein
VAQFRTTADIVDSVLLKSDEVTNGNSAFEARALEYINNTHHSIIAGGNEFDPMIDEAWLWAKSPRPMILELQPKYDTGTISLTVGSEAGTFSAAVTDSLEGWYIKVNGRSSVFRIATHTAGATAFELDGAYDDDTGATLEYKAYKLDYELVPSYIVIDARNNKLDFEETASTELTATLTSGSYTPADLATEIDTQLTAAGASAYTITYSAVTKKFTLASDRAGGGGTFKLLCQSGTNQATSAWDTIGFDVEDQADAASHTSLYIQGAVSKLFEPFTMHKGTYLRGSVFGMDENRFQRDFPRGLVVERYPEHFALVEEYEDGTVWVRFNAYPEEVTRIEVNYIPVPKDLKDNAQSKPLIPRKYLEVLEYAAASKIMFEKDNDKADGFFARAAKRFEAMMIQNRNKMSRIGDNFAQTIPREDNNAGFFRRTFRYGYTADNP